MTSAVKTWKHTAVAFQEEMCSNLSDVDWDVYEEAEIFILKDKIKMLLYGLSPVESKEAVQHIDKICEMIMKENASNLKGTYDTPKDIYMVFVFVVGTKDGENIESWPIFRVPKDNTGIHVSFIDIGCRVYESWKDFLENNKLSVHEYCYPKNGKYEYDPFGKTAIEFGQPPESKTSKKVQNALDVFSAGIGFGASILAISSIAFPVAAPLVAASTWAAGGVSAYSTYRSSTTLYDRKKHKQDIGLADREARSCYISIAGSALGLGASAATSATVRMAQSGQVLGSTATTAITALSGGALMMNGIGIANGLHHLIEKHKEGNLTAMDVAHFSASLLLFCHATVNFKTARSIIERSQDNIIQSYGNSLGNKWKRVMFRTAVKCTTKLRGTVGGKALVIRNIKHINTADEYFSSFLPEDESLSRSQAVLVSQSNITQIQGFEHLESLLSDYDKLVLKKLLMRFTEAFQKIILGLCDRFFQDMGKARDFDLMHIVSFVTEFANLLTKLISEGDKFYVLSLLQHAVNRVPCDDMTYYEYCLALFEELLLHPIPLITIYKLVKSFVEVLSKRKEMSKECQNIDFIKLVAVCDILLKTDTSYWEMTIDVAINIFDGLNLKKHSSFMKILKELLLYIQKRILNMQKRYEGYRCESRSREDPDSYDYQLRNDCESVLGSMYDNEIRTPFVSRLQGMNLDENPDEGIPIRSMESVYTKENPLAFQKHFWDREQLELLTEEEILETCKKTLKINEFPENYFIMHEGLEIIVSIGDTTVVIRCDLQNDMVVSYADLLMPGVTQNDTPLIQL